MTLNLPEDDLEPSEFEKIFIEKQLYQEALTPEDIFEIEKYISTKKESKNVSKEYITKLEDIYNNYKFLIDIDTVDSNDFLNLQQIDINRYKRDNESIDWDSIFSKLLTIQPIYYDEYDRFYYYSFSQKYWKKIDDIYIMIIIKRMIKECNIEGNKNKFLNMIKIKARLQEPKEPPINYVLFNNTIIDIETSERIEPTPKYLFKQKIPYDVGIQEPTPNIDKLLNSLTDSDIKKTKLLKELIAYCIIRDQRLNKMFFLVGNGSNGKSTFMSFVSRCLGEDNCVSISSEDINGKNSHGLVNCIDKLWIEWNEPSRYDLSQTSKFKQLVGGDNININPKNKKTINTKIYGKLVSPTNSLPQSNDKTDGFYRRLVHIMFNQKFTVQDTPPVISDEEISSFWAELVELAHNIYNEKKLSYMLSLVEIKKLHEKLSNPVYSYIDSNLEYAQGYNIPFWCFFESFNDWASRSGKGSESIKAVKEMLAQINLDYSTFDKKQFYYKNFRYNKIWRWIPNMKYKDKTIQKNMWKHIKATLTPEDNLNINVIESKIKNYFGLNTEYEEKTKIDYDKIRKVIKITLKEPKELSDLIEEIQFNYLTLFDCSITEEEVNTYINNKLKEGELYNNKGKIQYV